MDAHCYSEWEVIKHSIYIDVFYIDGDAANLLI